MKVSARDIAKAAQTSVASVSRAFRPDSPMSKDLRARILSVAQEMGYLPPGGRVSKKTGRMSLSLVVGDIRNPYYAFVLDAFSQAAAEMGIELFFHVVPSGKTVDATMHQVFSARTDGVIVTAAPLNSELAGQCRTRGLPVVLFGRVQVDSDLTAISGDNYSGGRQVAERFLSQGRNRIAFLGGEPKASTHLERRSGFLDLLEEAGAGLFAEYRGGFSYDIAHDIAAGQTEAQQRPDAIFCANDIMAFGVLDAMRRAGMDPGADIAVIGYDDVPMAAWHCYRLTTVRQQARQMVREALGVKPGLIADQEPQGRIIITPCDLIERDSG